MRVTLLGTFGVTCDGAPVSLPMGVQRVVAFVALHSRPVLRPYVAGSLWPNTADERAGANLRSVLWRLHRTRPEIIEAAEVSPWVLPPALFARRARVAVDAPYGPS